MRVLLAVAFVFAACTPHLGPTLIPVCSEDFEVTCRAPTRAANFGQGRDYEWEKRHVCHEREDWRCRSCYIFMGARDGRQVYQYRSFSCKESAQ